MRGVLPRKRRAAQAKAIALRWNVWACRFLKLPIRSGGLVYMDETAGSGRPRKAVLLHRGDVAALWAGN